MVCEKQVLVCAKCVPVSEDRYLPYVYILLPVSAFYSYMPSKSCQKKKKKKPGKV